MMQTMTSRNPTALVFAQRAQKAGRAQAQRIAALAATTMFFSFGSLAFAQGTLPVDELNTALENGLTEGRQAGVQLTCTATNVFFDSTFVKFVIGGIILITLVMAAVGWYNQSRNGVTMGRLFWIIVIFMAVVAIAGVLITSFMGC